MSATASNVRIILYFLLTAFCASSLVSQPSIREIRILQDKRDGKSEALHSFLRYPNAEEREWALLAVANIQDTSVVQNIIPLLRDKYPSVRAMAAFALGMTGGKGSAAALFERITGENDSTVLAALYNGIGMTGNAADLIRITKPNILRHSNRYFTLRSIIRFANRKIIDSSATAFAGSLMTDSLLKQDAVYALMRTNDTSGVRMFAFGIKENMTSGSPTIRMWSASLLGMLKDSASRSLLLEHAAGDVDWRVRVNAIRSLRRTARVQHALLSLFQDEHEHIALTAVSTYREVIAYSNAMPDSMQIVRFLQSEKTHRTVKHEIRKLLASTYGSAAIPLIGEWKQGQPYDAAEILRALGATKAMQAAPEFEKAIQSSSRSPVIAAAIEAYHSLARVSDISVQRNFLKLAADQFQKRDAGISYYAALSFQDSLFDKNLRKAFLPQLNDAFMEMESPADTEPMVELVNLFSDIGDSTVLSSVEKGLSNQEEVIRRASERSYLSITGKSSPVRFVKKTDSYTPFYFPEQLNELKKYEGAVITTSKGVINVRFEKNAAPFTVLNFILLAKKGFYDGLIFHRVVSNFVIQGGDPLGTGSGGPNYAIRTEVHPAFTYSEGAVGMASAGKDTEGSQWFVTHCATPHLDYRYTIFGYTKENDVVGKIMAGDTIISVTLR